MFFNLSTILQNSQTIALKKRIRENWNVDACKGSKGMELKQDSKVVYCPPFQQPYPKLLIGTFFALS